MNDDPIITDVFTVNVFEGVISLALGKNAPFAFRLKDAEALVQALNDKIKFIHCVYNSEEDYPIVSRELEKLRSLVCESIEPEIRENAIRCAHRSEKMQYFVSNQMEPEIRAIETRQDNLADQVRELRRRLDEVIGRIENFGGGKWIEKTCDDGTKPLK